MAAKGAKSKEQITAKILETFEGSFVYGKEIRIPIMEDGQLLQIKCTLTCAKTNVENGEDAAVPGAASAVESAFPPPLTKDEQVNKSAEPTEEEKKNIEALLKSLGLN